jgi:gluconolactonase
MKLTLRKALPTLIAGLLTLATAPGWSAPQDKRVKEIYATDSPAEGAAWYKGRVFFASQGRDALMVWDGQQANLFWERPGCQPSAIAVTRDSQHLLVACQQSGEVIQLNPMGQAISTLSQTADGEALIGITSLERDSRGGFYMGTQKGQILYLYPSLERADRVAQGLNNPQGLALGDQGKQLLVSDSGNRQILRYPIDMTRLGIPEVLQKVADMTTPSAQALGAPGPAALRRDSRGNLFVGLAGDGKILVTNPAGKVLNEILIPDPFITSISFGFTDRVLYVTTRTESSGGSGHLYEVRL